MTKNNVHTDTPTNINRPVSEEPIVITPVSNVQGGTEEAAPPEDEASTGESTLPGIREARDFIQGFEFNLDREIAREEEKKTTELAALMMFSTPTGVELPTLRTETWPYAGKKPNPISIGTAVKLLAAAYSEIPCETAGAGVHGYAWIVEDDAIWLTRDGTSLINPPEKPEPITEFDIKAQWEYSMKARRFTLYNHLIQEGKTKLVTWFGKEMFVDLHKDGVLPNTKTPKELITHLSATYALPRDRRRHMKQVTEEFNAPYDPKKSVEAYFMGLQDARTHAELLGRPFTDSQTMDMALQQFETHYEKDAYKAEKKWNERKAQERTWEDFKTYWKTEIHQYETMAGSKKQAHQVVDLNSLVESVNALKAETLSLQEDNATLTQRLEFQQALQAERSTDRGNDNDSISTLTNYIENLERRYASQQGDGSGGSRREEMLHTARNRNPKDYQNLNDGRGKRFSSYCWKCGCNCTHWTRKCLELSSSERRKYRDADFDNLMGGSTRFLDRRGKYQTDFNFDSL